MARQSGGSPNRKQGGVGRAIGVGRSAVLLRFEVSGDSMAPTYESGDRLLVFTRGRRIRVGDVVVVVDPREVDDAGRPTNGREMVKRVTAVHADGSVDVAGDNPAASTDSRTFGAVPASNVRGRVLRKY